ncbi:TetR/AcrR family transcriptional regulator [Lewinella sp. JB7]|uniref:TetR/AcrR family transcriptional regulator n=1 Tax=Lewinella sp. JB7 TaxID=2962887 RepID=UPI0020C9EF94|nr:TetR/AcrR family transcriptional regulator [Lewinella sp. JB7]MCP9234856.1 TetR/AcrR family transcriptional regulator [Lewinella sp. JB7]
MNVHFVILTSSLLNLPSPIPLPIQSPNPLPPKGRAKRDALVRATITLVNNNGFHAAPMAKIAKLAGVAAGTIYRYFDSKQDLINQVYIEVKRSFSESAFRDYVAGDSVEEDFRKIWHNIADFKLREVEKSVFLSQCDNTPMVDEDSRREGLKHLRPLLELWERGQARGVIRPVSPYVLYAFTIYPIAFLLHMQQRDLYQLSRTEIDEAYRMAWNSIKN